MDLQSNPVNEILYINFNQDLTCFVCGTESGFRVYSTDPFRLTHRRDFDNAGGLGVVCMLFRTNILAFAGGGKNPRFQPHKVVLWDDRQTRVIAEFSFPRAVKSVRLRRDLVVPVIDRKVFVYSFKSLTLIDSIETISNPKGLCCLSVGADRVVLVCPGMQKGRALVIFYPRTFGESLASVSREKTTIISAHDSTIAAMTVDPSGALLATASDKGTMIRVFDTATGNRTQELRRGVDRAEIHSLTFNSTGDWLVVSSDKGTVHVFTICKVVGEPGGPDGSSTNAKSSLQRISRVLPAYFSSEWSLAQFRIPDYRCIAAFGADPNTIVAVCANGSYYKARFNPVQGGEMVREDFAQFHDAAALEVAAADYAVSSSSVSAAPDTAAEDAAMATTGALAGSETAGRDDEDEEAARKVGAAAAASSTSVQR
eukprot:gnl/TRDRNA2_/TRDRNA2_187878_c0_seq1.p1 gnl/TRDRNA2_/TRDRNA2_187878_c0~~gnl/TRDRNA2_/TRDRNA2_187878_c0_seq1.p1  ORF type:complete len:427 (-),score=69.46 gnl/TRDRNA2_/TRDRNA2_187878_c0_seq1:93-1373(-)